MTDSDNQPQWEAIIVPNAWSEHIAATLRELIAYVEQGYLFKMQGEYDIESEYRIVTFTVRIPETVLAKMKSKES